MNIKEKLKKYRFKNDYHFNNDIYDLIKDGAQVCQWSAKKSDIVLGRPFVDEKVKGYISLQGEKIGLVESSILEPLI